MPAGYRRACRTADEVRAQSVMVDAGERNAQHQPMRSPVREVQVRIEVALHELRGIGLQVAPVVLVPETGRRDLRAGRDSAKLVDLLRREGPIDGEELVALVLAHRVPRCAARMLLPSASRCAAVATLRAAA